MAITDGNLGDHELEVKGEKFISCQFDTVRMENQGDNLILEKSGHDQDVAEAVRIREGTEDETKHYIVVHNDYSTVRVRISKGDYMELYAMSEPGPSMDKYQ